MKLPKFQTLGEELANAISHGLGAFLSVLGLILMTLKAKDPFVVTGVVLFGASSIVLYTMSSLYHAFKRDSIVKRVFRRFDHVSIYLLIGGTYLPIYIILFNLPWNLVFIIIQWSVILFGITLKSASFHRFKRVHFVLYLVLGWSGLVVFRPLYLLSVEAFYWIIFGGVSYTLGTLFYQLRKFKYNHFVWHLFVLGGTVLHFFAIYLHLL